MAEQQKLDEKYMRLALKEAEKAAKKDEVPVGAVIVKDQTVLARAHNLRETKKDPLAHAELLVLRKAARKLGGWRLTGCELYVTLEPCPMCAGAVIQARISRVVFGARDPKAGCCGSLYDLPEDSRFNHNPVCTGDVLAEECGAVLKAYFAEKRRSKKKQNTAEKAAEMEEYSGEERSGMNEGE